MLKNKFSRRNFLKTATCGAMGTTPMMSTLANLMVSNQLMASSTSPPNDYKALVCVLLSGGNDSFNMIVPRTGDDYNHYANARNGLALGMNQLCNLDVIDPEGIQPDLGIHSAMGGMGMDCPENTSIGHLFNIDRNAAIIANVGTLVKRIDDFSDYPNLVDLPLGLFSHSDQRQQWQTAMPHSRSSIGWGGQMADILQSCNTNQNISMNISLSGRNFFQAGRETFEYTVSGKLPYGVQSITPINAGPNSGFFSQIRRQKVKDMATQMYTDVFKQTAGSTINQSLESLEAFEAAIMGVSDFDTVFDGTQISEDLNMVAKTIAARDTLGMNRQTFFVMIGGWDNHAGLLTKHEGNLTELNDAIVSFMGALDEINMSDNVTLFTISDFGRTLTSNGGEGSDHAWGGNALVVGGAVDGGKIYGKYPSLQLNGSNPLMIDNRGRLIPTTSTDEYFATLALWYGVSRNDLPILFPNINEFYDIYDIDNTAPPLEFLNF